MKVILNCTNLLGDSLYLLRPVQVFLQQTKIEDVLCIVADKGLAYELFNRTFGHLVPVFSNEHYNKEEFEDVLIFDLNAGRSGEIAFQHARDKGRQLHISEGYAQILGISLGNDIKPPLDWTYIHKPLERTFAAISPFSRSCSRHSGMQPNKTLDDYKWEYLIQFLRRHGMRVKVVAGPNDSLQNVDIPLDDYFTAKNLYELEYFLKSCKMLISVDNGLGHIASLLDTPMISLWPRVSNIDFIGPRFSPWTSFVMMDPNTVAPAQLLAGIRQFVRRMTDRSDEDQIETILREGEQTSSTESA